MRLTLEMRRAIARALAYKCQAGRGSCPVEGVCPFDMECTEVKPWQWEKALGIVHCKKVKNKTAEAENDQL